MIVVIAGSQDVHAQAVLDALNAQGERNIRRLDLTDFPLHMTMRLHIHQERSESVLACADGTLLRMEEARAIWWRRPGLFRLPAQMTATDRHFAFNEALMAFQGIWQASSAFWINDVARDAGAQHKAWQLTLARQLGLTIPETLITNSPHDARDFWNRHPGNVIYKPFQGTAQAWRETRLLKPEEQQLSEAIRLAPVIFQTYVPALAELRVTIVGERVFAAAARLEQAEYQADVRYNANLAYKPHALPDDITRQLLLLMRRLGLEYGAIDMRLTPEGEYVFLEINPAGQFWYIEQSANLPIAAALAEHLRAATPTTSSSQQN